MKYNKTYFIKYLALDEKTRKASKDHWLNIFAHDFSCGRDCELSSSILAAITLAEDVIAKNK